MPVWHDVTREAREAGELVVIGLAQEQHPERCRLYAQWQELEWPILWDPFNLSGARVVPSVFAIDEHGILRHKAPKPQTLAEDFLEVEYEAPVDAPTTSIFACAAEGCERASVRWKVPGPDAPADELDELVEVLEDEAYVRREAILMFRAGVARRMRYDSSAPQEDDFQAAVDHWRYALASDPGQYIWRRRIQQYGPRMDKPYPFYSWVTEAEEAVRARGEEPVALVATLTPAELAQPSRNTGDAGEPRDAAAEAREPGDADRNVPLDEGDLVRLETAVAFDTSRERAVASVHLAFRPDAEREVHWNHEAGPPLTLWLEDPEEQGSAVEPRRYEVAPRADAATSDEVQRLTVEVRLPRDADGVTLRGFAVYAVCEGESGTCRMLRREVELDVARR